MNRLDEIAWLLFLIVLSGATAFVLLLSSLAILE